MKIKSIKAFAITNPIAGGTYDERQGQGHGAPSAMDQGCRGRQPDVALSRATSALRSSWNKQFPAGRLHRHGR